jgi:hypothetical protein
VFQSLFQLLFEYRPVVFQQGDFRFQPPAGAYIALAAAFIVIAASLASYRTLPSRLRLVDRLVLGALRIAALAILLFCLFRPVLVVKAAAPQQNVLGVLVDDSRSMQIADWRGQLARNRQTALVGAAVAGFVIGGGVAASISLLRRRRR